MLTWSTNYVHDFHGSRLYGHDLKTFFPLILTYLMDVTHISAMWLSTTLIQEVGRSP